MGKAINFYLAGSLAVASLFAGPAVAQDVTAAADGAFEVQTVAEGLDFPWSIAFLPDGDMLVTELSGQLRLIDDGTLVDTVVGGTPKVLYAGQGGLSDVVLHPDFATNKLVYLTYSAARDEGNTLVVGRGTFTGSAVENFEVIFEADAYRKTIVHYGARMAFLNDGTFILTSGDGFDYREQAQITSNDFGSTIRLNDDGSIPADNPFVGDDAARDEIYSYGHRNPQAILQDAASGVIYANEHGPQGGDEINVIEPGNNYGWPIATYGVDYTGAYVSPLKSYPNATQPLLYWVPSIAPSGMTLVTGNAFADWNGDLLVTALAPGNVSEFANRNMRRVILEDGAVAGQEAIRVVASGTPEDETPRLRDVRMAPDGSIYVLTDGEGGKVLRLIPAGGMPQAAVTSESAVTEEAAAETEPGIVEKLGGKAAAIVEDAGTAIGDAAEEAVDAAEDVAEDISDAVSDMADEAAAEMDEALDSEPVK